MNKFLVLALLSLTGLVANAQSTAIEGNWGTRQEASGITFDITFSIGKNSVTVTNLCSGFGTSAKAQVTTASMYSDKTITVFEYKQDQKSNGPLDCNVSTQPDTMNYSVQGNQLVFTHDGSPDSIILFRK
jgi:hypothetical protein